jgi:diaminopimelate epimerase
VYEVTGHLPLSIIKAHAYGNDFLYVARAEVERLDAAALAVRLCDRHRGAGADGLILYELTPEGARMRLVNADGSHAELSGNGLRALAAIVVRHRSGHGDPATRVRIDTDAGPRELTLTVRAEPRYTFRASMGTPAGLRRERIEAGGESVDASVFSIGNPQCVILGPLPDDERFARLGPALESHPRFPGRTNVEFVDVESPERVRIRIWERGVGPTESSGTGACASAIAAIAHGGAAPRVEVVSPGGSQVVEWDGTGEVWLTGWAELVWEGTWLADL